MSESLNQEPNKVVLTISGVRDNPAQPWVQRIIISIQNSVDNTDNFNSNNSEDIPGYKEAEDLEEILQDIIKHLRLAYHIPGVDITEGEE
jgi:hypothetical protein